MDRHHHGFMLRKNKPGAFAYRITIRVGQEKYDQDQAKMAPHYAFKFDDVSTSDFRVKCKDAIFHVHQWILANRCEFFAAILRNDCIESRNKELSINDFQPNVVRLLLLYIYNGTLILPFYKGSKDMLENMSALMQIADKYDFQDLVNTCDSYIAQWFACILKTGWKTHLSWTFEKFMTRGIARAEKLSAKKWASAVFLWKFRDESGEYETLWSSLMKKYPNFAVLATIAATRHSFTEKCWFLETFPPNLQLQLKKGY